MKLDKNNKKNSSKTKGYVNNMYMYENSETFVHNKIIDFDAIR